MFIIKRVDWWPEVEVSRIIKTLSNFYVLYCVGFRVSKNDNTPHKCIGILSPSTSIKITQYSTIGYSMWTLGVSLTSIMSYININWGGRLLSIDFTCSVLWTNRRYVWWLYVKYYATNISTLGTWFEVPMVRSKGSTLQVWYWNVSNTNIFYPIQSYCSDCTTWFG